MSDDERADALQESLHGELAALLRDELGEEGEGGLLVGWVLAYEAQAPSGRAFAGHLYGPAGMTTWRALGLIEWTRLHTLGPDSDDD